MSMSIQGAVGMDEKSENHVADVLVVQTLLNRFILAGVLPRIRPLLPLPMVTDAMVGAIRAFQHDILGFHNPDGRVDPGGKTLKRLNGPIPSPVAPVPKVGKGVAPPAPPNPAGTESFSFPFPKLPMLHWTGGSRFFGAKRGKKQDRRHAGCDLIFPHGTKIYAIADGTHVSGPYQFTGPNSDPPYPLSHAVEIEHGPILVRYGELDPGSYTEGTQGVTQGQVIARVSKLGMLHLEIYTNPKDRKPLSNAVLPFKRRGDVTDPDPYLQLWAKNLPKASP